VDIFYSFIQRELLGGREGTNLEQILSHLARLFVWSAEKIDGLRDYLAIFIEYLVDNFLPCKF
jgi:hypothetical protein